MSDLNPTKSGDFAGTPTYAPTTQIAPESTVKPEDVIEVLRQCFDPEIPVNIVDLGLIYDIAIKPERVDIKMTLTALGCPMAAEVMTDAVALRPSIVASVFLPLRSNASLIRLNRNTS